MCAIKHRYTGHLVKFDIVGTITSSSPASAGQEFKVLQLYMPMESQSSMCMFASFHDICQTKKVLVRMLSYGTAEDMLAVKDTLQVPGIGMGHAASCN